MKKQNFPYPIPNAFTAYRIHKNNPCMFLACLLPFIVKIKKIFIAGDKDKLVRTFASSRFISRNTRVSQFSPQEFIE
jgi:hypothetical protein